MIKKRGRSQYELSTAEWDKIKDLLLGKAGERGRTAADNRLLIDSTLVKAHHQAATYKKKSGSGAFPRWTND